MVRSKKTLGLELRTRDDDDDDDDYDDYEKNERHDDEIYDCDRNDDHNRDDEEDEKDDTIHNNADAKHGLQPQPPQVQVNWLWNFHTCDPTQSLLKKISNDKVDGGGASPNHNIYLFLYIFMGCSYIASDPMDVSC